MRTAQDLINRKEANRRYYRLEENKEQKREYMKEYRERPYVREKYEAKLKRKKNICLNNYTFLEISKIKFYI